MCLFWKHWINVSQKICREVLVCSHLKLYLKLIKSTIHLWHEDMNSWLSYYYSMLSCLSLYCIAKHLNKLLILKKNIFLVYYQCWIKQNTGFNFVSKVWHLSRIVLCYHSLPHLYWLYWSPCMWGIELETFHVIVTFCLLTTLRIFR